MDHPLPSSRLSLRDAWLGLLIAVLFVCAFSAVSSFHAIYEDAFITFRYAENLHRGCGLSFNCDGTRVEGYTNFLWLVALSLSLHLGGDVMLNARVLGLLCSLAALAGTYLLCRRAHARTAWVPTALLALSCAFAYHAGFGLESSLQMGLLVVLCLVEARESAAEAADRARRAGGGGASDGRGAAGGGASRGPWVSSSALVCAALALVRPENALLFVALSLRRLLSLRRSPAARRAALVWVLTFTLPFLAYHLWRYSTFGALLPTSFYAKAAIGNAPLLTRLLAGLAYLGRFCWQNPVWLLIPLALVLRRLRRCGSAAEARPEARAVTVTASWLVGCQLVLIVYLGGDDPGYFFFRFVTHVLPLLHVLLHAELVALLRGRRLALTVATALLVAGATLVTGTRCLGAQLRPPFLGYFLRHVFLRNVLSYEHTGSYYVEVGRHLARTTPPTWVIASFSSGELPYFSRRTFVDLFGLTDPHFSVLQAQGLEPDPHRGYLQRRLPDLFVLELPPRPVIEFLQRNQYSLDRVVLCRREAVSSPFVWPGGDQHLYLFVRRDHARPPGKGPLITIIDREWRFELAAERFVVHADLAR